MKCVRVSNRENMEGKEGGEKLAGFLNQDF